MLLLGAFIGAAISLLAFAVPLVTAAGDSGEISLSATALAFAAQAVGTASDAQAVRLTNVGSVPATISTFRIHGANVDDFAQGADCPVAPDQLAPGASCAV